MKKRFLCIAVILIIIMNATAQEIYSSQTELINIDSISKELNILQHKFDLLECQYKIDQSKFKFTNSANELNIKSNTIITNCFHKNTNIDLYNVYKEYYYSQFELLESLKTEASTIKIFVGLKMISSNFSSEETKLLNLSLEMIDKHIESTEKALSYYKTVLNIYKGLL